MLAAMSTLPEHARALRAFSRFYTRRIGVLDEHLLNTRFTLPESRVLWELAHAPGLTATALAHELGLDAGYLSRLLAGLRERGLVRAAKAPDDGRQTLLSLSAAGRRAFGPLDRRAQEQACALLTPLSGAEQQALADATQRITSLLGSPPAPITLRPPQAGDMGWVVSRHGALYAAEYGWDTRFEALVARIVADFVDRFDAQREACWIAERGGLPLGCVFLVQARDEATAAPEAGVAQLRMLLVEPAARGQALGKRLVQACDDFAAQAGYRQIRLWTNSVLSAARGIYTRAGYELQASEAHHSFGHDLVGEIWEKTL